MCSRTSRSRLTGAKEVPGPMHGNSCRRLFLMLPAPSSMGLFRLPINCSCKQMFYFGRWPRLLLVQQDAPSAGTFASAGRWGAQTAFKVA